MSDRVYMTRVMASVEASRTITSYAPFESRDRPSGFHAIASGQLAPVTCGTSTTLAAQIRTGPAVEHVAKCEPSDIQRSALIGPA